MVTTINLDRALGVNNVVVTSGNIGACVIISADIKDCEIVDADLASGVFGKITGVGTQSQTLVMGTNAITTTSSIDVGVINCETGGNVAFTIADCTGAITAETCILLAETVDIATGCTTGSKIATAACQKLGFWGATPVIQGCATSVALTDITHTSACSCDFALQDLINCMSYGFVTKDEGNTVLAIVLNLQTRVTELETLLSDSGISA